MALASRSLHPVKNFDLTWDTRYPDGSKPQVQPSSLGVDSAAFTAALINLTNIKQGTATAVNYRTYLTGTSAATATLTVNAISGQLGNWGISGSNLTNDGSVAGSGSLQVTASDGINTASFPVQNWSIVVAAQKQRFKSNFGLYIYLDRNNSTSQKLARMQYFSQFPAVKGFQDIRFWAQWENPNLVGGDAQYDGSWDASGDSGLAYHDKMVAACAAMSPPRHWMPHLSTYGFAGASGSKSTSFPTSFMPSYLQGSTYGANTAATNGLFGGAWINCYNSGLSVAYFARWWSPATQARLQNLIAWYGSKRDSHPLWEMPSFVGESAHPAGISYSDALAMTGYPAIWNTFRTNWPTTQGRFWANYNFTQAQWNTLLQQAVETYNLAVGGPDCVNETGVGARSFVPDQTYRTLGYVGKGAWIAEFEPDEEGPRAGGAGNPALGSGNWDDYIQHAKDQGAQYVTVFDNGWTGNNVHRTQGYLNTQPSHPDALDYMTSVFNNGASVNGAKATVFLNPTNPSLWPTG